MKKWIKSRMLHQNRNGFSLAELMMAVAIIGILAGVAFISVANYMRSMALLERDGIAKEIFVAAQNHLTMVEGQGFLGISETQLGTRFPFTNDEGKEIDSYYFVINSGSGFSDESMIGLMLPFGSVDETVRMGGNYIIHYQLKPARVLNVLYSASNEGARYPYSFETLSTDFIETIKVKNERRDYHGAVIGYFGEKEAQSVGDEPIFPPIIQVINAERLTVRIKDQNEVNKKITLNLIVKGKESGKTVRKPIKIAGELANNDNNDLALRQDGSDLVYTMDDITTKDLHFANLFEDFKPGEDVIIHAEAEASDAFSGIESSAEFTTNSLFADNMNDAAEAGNNVSGTGGTAEIGDASGKDPSSVALIANIRHFENLDPLISQVDSKIKDAYQITDLDWEEFKKAIQDSGSAYNIYQNRSEVHTNGYFYPVSPNSGVSYHGAYKDPDNNNQLEYHKIRRIEVDTTKGFGGAGGLFGKIEAKEGDSDDVIVEHLELIDFKIVSGGDSASAGALAGEAANVGFENIVVYNTSDFDKTLSKKNVTAESGSAGGLIGKITGGKITQCAAALTVQGNSAGGLVGDASSECEITESYSGGHTRQGNYAVESSNTGNSNPSGGNTGSSNTGEDTFSSSPYNVMGSDTAGGFAGTISNVKITKCYSTCSVASDGSAVGGFIGSGSGTVSECYCTGLVSGANAGAFAGSGLSSASDCLYFEIINEKVIPEGATDDTVTGYEYLKAGSGDKDIGGVSPLDENIDTYDLFFQNVTPFAGSGSPRVAKPYDTDTLGSAYFGNMLESEETDQTDSQSEDTQNGESANTDKIVYVKTHYGDWPTPEILVINETQTPSAETG